MGSGGTVLNAGPGPDLSPSGRRIRDAGLVAGTLVLAGLILLSARSPRDTFATPSAARAALARDPLNIAAIRSLGLMRDREGGDASADALLDFAGRRTWRDGPTQVWLVQRRLEQGRYAEALRRADALLRQDDEGPDRRILFPLLVAAIGREAMRPELAARLAQNPGWRGDFLRSLGAAGAATDIAPLFAALAGGPSPPRPEEYAPFVNRLAADRDYPAALAAWNAATGRSGATAAALRDDDLSAPSDGTPFTWSVATGAGVRSATTGARLDLDYDGVSSPSLPTRLLVLSPGPYRLSWRESAAQGAAGSLFWRLRCAGSDQVIAREASAGPGTQVEHPVSLDFEVPSENCAGLWLELAADPGERPAEASFGFRQMRLVRRP